MTVLHTKEGKEFLITLKYNMTCITKVYANVNFNFILHWLYFSMKVELSFKSKSSAIFKMRLAKENYIFPFKVRDEKSS